MTRPLAVCLAGHVDHGKSSLLGRLLHELDLLPEGKVAKMEAASSSRGVPLEWSFALDSLQLERDQAVTLDTTRVHVRTPRRELIVIDCPGHRELVRNLVTGAAGTSAALLVVDGQLGAEAQTRAHAALLRLLGVRDFVVAVNKMDALNWSEERFDARRSEIASALTPLGVEVHAIVPTSARDGGNIAATPPAAWWEGPTLVAALEALPAEQIADPDAPLRLPVQDVYRTGTRRAIAGRIAQGTLRAGAELMVLPSGARAHVASLDGWPTAPASAVAGDNVALTFAEPVIVERGDLLCAAAAPARLTPVFDADIFWLGHEPLAAGRRCELRVGARAVAARVAAVIHALDIDRLVPRGATDIAINGVGRVTIRCDQAVAVDDVIECLETGRFVLADAGVIIGGGLISASHYPDQRRALPAANRNVVAVDHYITAEERGARAGHVGAVVWLTGLSGAGKSTLAMALERALFDRGWAAYTIDGDNVRRGLNADLGFSPGDRQENIRRVGEVAALFADAGLVCITAFISPFDDDRARARAAAGSRRFFEVYVKSELATCEARDPKGLYGKARRGEIRGFTGIDSPYEAPAAPDLVIDTQHLDQAACIAQLVEFVTANCRA
ncbi:MAG TPA: adenylyl-sulfate kinase [Casimicrobiaceae bacterium]|nr:adenylyl-sulfate kinase [Casimicrobiaceae bacterium]